MYIARDMFCFAVPLTISTGVGGCWWPISARVVLMYVFFWKFSNNPPNYLSVDDAITFLIMLNYTCTDPFSGGISCIGVLDFGRRKKHPLALLRASGSDITFSCFSTSGIT